MLMANVQDVSRSYGTMKDKDINFYKMYYRKPEKTNEQKNRQAMILSVIVVALLIGAFFGGIEYKTWLLNGQLNTIHAYTMNASVVSEYTRAQTAESSYAAANKEYNDLKNLKNVLGSYAILSKDDFAAIDACGGTSVTTEKFSFDQSASKLNFTAVSGSCSIFPDYINRLLVTGLFSDVSYSGYNINSAGSYEAEITCVVKAAKTNG